MGKVKPLSTSYRRPGHDGLTNKDHVMLEWIRQGGNVAPEQLAPRFPMLTSPVGTLRNWIRALNTGGYDYGLPRAILRHIDDYIAVLEKRGMSKAEIERTRKMLGNGQLRYNRPTSSNRRKIRPARRPAPPSSPAKIAVPAEKNFSGELDRRRQYAEGAVSRVLVNRYERDPDARAACLEEFGCKCSVCKFDFEGRYGEIGYGFIHVHHLKPLALRKKKYRPDPTKDLAPVCPNCHHMLHTSNPPLTIAELREIWVQNNGT